jgi:hypothetical protein
MKNPDWKKKFHEPHLTAAQKVKVLEQKVLELAEERDKAATSARYYKQERDQTRLDAARYDALRRKEVMVFDGEPKYLVNEALDEYCDTIKDDFYGMSLSEMINQMGRSKSSGFFSQPTQLMVPPAMAAQAQQILKDYKNGYGNMTPEP